MLIELVTALGGVKLLCKQSFYCAGCPVKRDLAAICTLFALMRCPAVVKKNLCSHKNLLTQIITMQIGHALQGNLVGTHYELLPSMCCMCL